MMNKEKIGCFIVPYFGKLPSYFQLFLNSCNPNRNFTWLLITDDRSKFNYPDNVIVKYESWSDFVNNIQQKFDFPINLTYPRKLCDLKPMYGYLFEDCIKNYKYWGYCDIDTIMGNLDKTLTEKFLSNYDKLFSLGHLTLFRNNIKINRLFMNKINGECYYKKVLTTNKILVFDELGAGTTNIDDIFVENGMNVFHEDWSFNPRVTPTKFIRLQYNYKNNSFIRENKKKSILIWDGKNIIRYIFCGKNNVISQKFLYIHLQQRRMNMKKGVENASKFAIIPNLFIPLKSNNQSDIQKIHRWSPNLHYLRIMWKWKIKARFNNNETGN